MSVPFVTVLTGFRRQFYSSRWRQQNCRKINRPEWAPRPSYGVLFAVEQLI